MYPVPSIDRRTLCAWLMAMPVSTAGTLVRAQKKPPCYQVVKASRDGIGKLFMGREIAGVMGWQDGSRLDALH